MTAYGRGVLGGAVDAPQAEAVGWFEKAAAAGEPEGMFSLAAALIQGASGAADPKAALAALEDAARWGHPAGQAVAAAALSGMGPYADLDTERAPGAAYVWFDRAAAGGVDGAAEARDAIGRALTLPQKSALNAASAAWRPGTAPDLSAFAAIAPPDAAADPAEAAAPPPS